MDPTPWRSWGRYVAAALAAAVLACFAFVLRTPVPVFDWIDLGVHELGHMLVMGGPRMLHFLAGSLLQVLVPAALAVYFLWRQRDLAGSGFCAAWAGTSAWDVSVYIADAPVQALPLIGGGTHDWAYLLGPQGWDALERAGSIAGFVDVMGMAAAAGGIGLALWPALQHVRGARRSTPAVTRSAPEELPVREPLPLQGEATGPAPAHAVIYDEDDQVIGEPADPDPWLAASQLPFFADSPGERSS